MSLSTQSGQQQRRQDGDNRDDDEKLNQCERPAKMPRTPEPALTPQRSWTAKEARRRSQRLERI